MSVYIKGMEMPKKCIHCELQTYGLCGVQCDKDISRAVMDSVRDTDCPLIPVPDHGRLIDADALKKMHHWTDDYYEIEYVEVEDIDAAPTIIPADKEVDDG